ncbi:MAG: class I SAM-dependent methyltransferase [Streptosporangiaceae bacterium]
MHQQIADRTADLALALTLAPQPQRILDVGCGTGYLLRQFAVRCPQAVEVAGVDPAPAMIGAARTAGTDGRLWGDRAGG